MPATSLRLLHVSQPDTAGVARCVLALATAQQAEGHEVHVACPPGGPLARGLASHGVPVHPWEATRSPGASLVHESRRLARTVARLDPSVVHLHSSKAGLAGRLVLRGRRPTVFQPHAWSFDAVTGGVRRATVAWERTAARWTSLLLCVSEAERRAGAAAGVRVARSVVVPNGVDVRSLLPAGPLERARARQQLGLPGGPLVVCVGRLTRQKGQDVLLDAWPQVRRRVPDAHLVLVGGGPDDALLRSAAGPAVSFAGETDDAGSWLAAADVVAVPSRWEGMALVPLEAMATARSVVASDVSGMRESLPAAAGALVPPEDVRALADALVARLSRTVDPDAEGAAGRAHVEGSHDVRRTAAATTAAYRQVLR